MRNTQLELVRAIAFYLPQYHPIPENDVWWGKGFTEWTNVAKAKPLFRGHHQPHLPADLGFYDLRLPEARQAQADLAREYSIRGFCYYHYWFSGRRILERPFNEVLESGKPDFPFCLCWANENWTRRWDGQESDVLLSQHYSREDDLAHIKSLIPAFQDERYIKIDGKPLFLVYRTELLPDPLKTTQIWREAAAQVGIDDLYLVRVEGFRSDINPNSIGFDAAVEFAPAWGNRGEALYRGKQYSLLRKLGLLPKAYSENQIYRYQSLVDMMLDNPVADYVRFPCIIPAWDNSARRSKGASIFVGSTPENYENWLRSVVKKTRTDFEGDQRIVFINAWNEWGEGCHLEPCQKWGRAYLEATQRVLLSESF